MSAAPATAGEGGGDQQVRRIGRRSEMRPINQDMSTPEIGATIRNAVVRSGPALHRGR